MFNLNSLGLCACLLMPFSTVIAYDDSQLGPILATAKAVATVKQVMQSHKGELDNDEEMLDKGSQLTRTLFCEAGYNLKAAWVQDQWSEQPAYDGPSGMALRNMMSISAYLIETNPQQAQALGLIDEATLTELKALSE
ncbi:hypothetical protein [Shewanella chilikensis]|uniref:hypothetical protein n=1 Tax=Shewanella chilikensis TaxID=558541 RepID=UPI001F3F77C8|nr:hypothetical protein [Shewanella chilikensis]MCE9786749.1 hypothetical protein [Shewanella chilikensis]